MRRTSAAIAIRRFSVGPVSRPAGPVALEAPIDLASRADVGDGHLALHHVNAEDDDRACRGMPRRRVRTEARRIRWAGLTRGLDLTLGVSQRVLTLERVEGHILTTGYLSLSLENRIDLFVGQGFLVVAELCRPRTGEPRARSSTARAREPRHPDWIDGPARRHGVLGS